VLHKKYDYQHGEIQQETLALGSRLAEDATLSV